MTTLFITSTIILSIALIISRLGVSMYKKDAKRAELQNELLQIKLSNYSKGSYFPPHSIEELENILNAYKASEGIKSLKR